MESVVSTLDDRFMTLDIKNFYYNTPMARYEYMKIALEIIPEEIVQQYNLHDVASNGWV